MNVKITTFTNPFSFFCVPIDLSDHCEFNLDNPNEIKKTLLDTSKIGDINHGQYLAVMWKNKWARGVVSMEKQFLIWLIDYGIFLRPTEKTVFKELPLEYRKLPTKVFEAGLHGIIPINKVLTDDCQIKNKESTDWTPGAIEKAQILIKNALNIFFYPVALLTTMHNHVVIGDLYLELEKKRYVNLIDELVTWPVFAERNTQAFITNISKCYVSRRHHRACMLKPILPDTNVFEITLQINLKEYEEILAKLPDRDNLYETESDFVDGSTIVEYSGEKDTTAFKITPSDIERFSNSYLTINGMEYNVLSVLVNKARDLNICERYKDHDLKSIGRGISYRRFS